MAISLPPIEKTCNFAVNWPIDLCDVLSSFAPNAKATLHELCRATGKPKAPPWVMKDKWGLRGYFDALGGIDVDKYDSDEEAADELQVETDNEIWHAKEDFLSEALSRCGSVSTTSSEDVPHGGFPAETTYQYWWAENPREIVEKFRAKLQSMLLEKTTDAVKITSDIEQAS